MRGLPAMRRMQRRTHVALRTSITCARGCRRRARSRRRRSVPTAPAPDTYDYAVIRVVPRVEREEFVNVGAVVSCPARGFLEARIELDPARVRALDPAADIEWIRAHLDAIAVICRGGP